ncbi:MAG: 6-phosphofructokinase [Candidatus Cyclobacteriaceae bacterium M3_2C_046]
MKKIAVFTSGGDSPGMNACVRAVVRGGIYHGVDVYGINRGYNGMISDDIYLMNSHTVSNILQRGGTLLKSARSKEFMTPEGRQKAYENLKKRGIEGIVAIGGDGTFTGAEIFYNEFGLPTVGAPGTIDNDLYGTDYTIGFDTAVNTALDTIDKIKDTANSHDRIFFIEVMGRNCGDIAIHAGIGSGAELVLIPETTTSTTDIIRILKKAERKSKTSSIVIVAEGNQEGNAFEVSKKVKEEMPDINMRVSILGHVQRGGSPTSADRILASRLGLGAVEGLLDGEINVMAGIVKGELVYTPLKDAITRKKPLDEQILRMVRIIG